MFDIQLFGRIEVRTRGVRLAGADFGGDRPRHLLALLALRGEASISELADLLGTGKKTLAGDLGILREHLEPGVTERESVIVTQRGRLRLNPERVRIDVARFDELITVAAGRPAERAVKPLTAAAFLASRPLLEDEDAPWAAEARTTYRAKLAMARPVAATAH
jgi:DNA-binding SARP family transcriptional activator